MKSWVGMFWFHGSLKVTWISKSTILKFQAIGITHTHVQLVLVTKCKVHQWHGTILIQKLNGRPRGLIHWKHFVSIAICWGSQSTNSFTLLNKEVWECTQSLYTWIACMWWIWVLQCMCVAMSCFYCVMMTCCHTQLLPIWIICGKRLTNCIMNLMSHHNFHIWDWPISVTQQHLMQISQSSRERVLRSDIWFPFFHV